jgi:hypothetical protein
VTYAAEVKNAWSYTFTPPYLFVTWSLNTGTILPSPKYIFSFFELFNEQVYVIAALKGKAIPVTGREGP